MSDIKVKILAVDDNIVNIKVLGQYLIKQGYEVITADTGEQAIEFIENEHFDIILLDNKLPGIEGIEVLEYIKEKEYDLLKALSKCHRLFPLYWFVQ